MTVLLVDSRDRPVARLPAFDVSTPWIPEVAEVVSRVLRDFGVDVLILRVLNATERRGRIEVTYAGEQRSGVLPTAIVRDPGPPLVDDARRHRYARPGGALADLEWAAGQLATPVQEAVQVRTWNLSCIWRIETSAGRFWLKVVPPFFAHEGALLRSLRGEPVPRVLASDGCRMLLEDMPGEDCWGADEALMREMIATLVDMQWRFAARVESLLAIGVPDRRGPRLAQEIKAVLSRHRRHLAPDHRLRLDGFVGEIDERMLAVDACGMQNSFVHGDYHPGNWRGMPGGGAGILDWGDCSVGHPLLDLPALLDRLPAATRAALQDHWLACWQARLPKADVARAARLIEPVALAAKAATYQMFLDNIERAERFHHEADPLAFLNRTAAALEAESGY